MTEAVQHKVSLGVFAGLIGVILAALLGYAPAPAQAVTNLGGLEFNISDQGGVTTSNLTFDGTTVTINNGDDSYTVTQNTLGADGKATNIVISGDYSGTITLDNVVLTNSAAEINGGSVITFCGSGATVIATNGTTLTGAAAGATINMQGAAKDPETDTFVLQSGATVINQGKGAAITSGSTGTYYADNVIELAGGSVVGGLGNASDMSTYQGAINVADNGTGSTTTLITASAATTVEGVSYAPADAQLPISFAAPAMTVLNQKEGSATMLEGTSPITFQGGSSTFQPALGTEGNIYQTFGMPGILITQGNLQMGGEYGGDAVDGGIITTNGGRGADLSENGNYQSVGGDGVLVYPKSSASASFTVNNGTLQATGGVGGADSAANEQSAIGGCGVMLSGEKCSNDYSATLNINGGNVTLTGGAGGNSTIGQANGGPGLGGCQTATYQPFQKLNVAYNSEYASEPPTVTIVHGDKLGDKSAIQNIGVDGANINIETGTKDDTYLWVAYTTKTNAAPTADNPGTLAGFAGMNSDNKDDMQQALNWSYAADGAATHTPVVNYVRIEQAPLESVQMAVMVADSNPDNNIAQDYVVAQTQKSMSGILADPTYVYEAALLATFEGLENVDTGVFNAYSGITLPKGATFDPAANASTNNAGVVAPDFYVPNTATGNSMTVTSAGNPTIPTTLVGANGLYPSLTIEPGTVNIVYTVTVTNGTGTGVGEIAAGTNPAQTATNPVNVYTNPNGDGTLVAADPTQFNTPDLEVTPLQTIIAANANSTAQFIGLFNETGETYSQVSNDQVTGWSGNAQLVAEWGAMKLTGVTPSPATVEQGASVDLTAAYELTPNNAKITRYSVMEAGVTLTNWNAVFVNTGFGSAESNGVTVAPTGGNTATGEAPLMVTAVATVSANATANLGNYRVWPTLGNFASDGKTPANPANTNPTGVYATVAVIGGTVAPEGDVTVWRIHNPNTGEHIYTVDANEYAYLGRIGWDPEGEAWIAPAKSEMPIYRLYNPNNGDHMYTISLTEYNGLQKAGWKGEGEKMYSAAMTEKPIYRLYDPAMTADGGAYNHLWTADYNEYNVLANSHNWVQEGVSWWAINVDEPTD